MGILSTIKGWFNLVLSNRARNEFDITPVSSDYMDTFVKRCVAMYQNNPEWLDEDNHIKTVNFAKAVCSETARLATLATSIQISGGARAEWLQQQIDDIYFDIRRWVEYGCAYGTIVLKPYDDGVECVTPDRFVITATRNGEITGIVFQDTMYDDEQKKYFTRLEYHRFIKTNQQEVYAISNRFYVSESKNSLGDPVPVERTPWIGISEEVIAENVDKPLFAVFKTPTANNVEIDSPLGMPIFADAVEEMKDLDIAYSRNAKEIFDSKRTVLLDSDRLLPSGNKVSNTVTGFKRALDTLELPDYIKAVYGNGVDEMYHEINPTLNTEMRLNGINALLSQIGYKCGFSNGYFVFNESGGIATATQVEADQQRTVQFIKDVRDQLEKTLDALIYALDKFADTFGVPVGTYEVSYGFGDLVYSYEEDKSRWYSYVIAGKVPFWYYLVKFEGMTEEEAKELESAAAPKETLFVTEEE